jgi:hypothetical protein
MLKRPGFGAHHSAYPLPMLRMSGAVTPPSPDAFKSSWRGTIKVYTKPTATVDAYLVFSSYSYVYLIIAWTHSTRSNFSIWRNAFLYLQGECQMWLYLINGLLYCFSSCSSKANSDHISIWTQLHSWNLFLEDYSRCVKSNSLLRDILWMSAHRNREPFWTGTTNSRYWAAVAVACLRRGVLSVSSRFQKCVQNSGACAVIAKFFGSRAKLSLWPSLKELWTVKKNHIHWFSFYIMPII